MAGCQFNSLAEQNGFLAQWEKSTADTRIHGTTKEQVGHRFQTHEQAALLPLPAGHARLSAPGRDLFSPKQLNDACKEALSLGAWRLREVKALLARPSSQLTLGFLEEHPLSQYQELYPNAFASPETPSEP